VQGLSEQLKKKVELKLVGFDGEIVWREWQFKEDRADAKARSTPIPGGWI